jgi:outer membrane protein assembly factor BamB
VNGGDVGSLHGVYCQRTVMFAITAAVALGVAPAAVPSDDEDVPKRQPNLAWERDVDCDAAAGAEAPIRRCAMTVAGDAVYLLEYTSGADSATGSRLSRYDIATGDELWRTDAGPLSAIAAYDDAVLISDKSNFEVYDPETGARRFARDGTVGAVNRYGTLLLTDGAAVTALDPVSGERLWTKAGALGTYCRDIVIVIAAKEIATGAEPFAVLDHRTGEERWSSDVEFDTRRDEVTCGFGPYVYSTDGDELTEWEATSGWQNWSVTIEDAGDLEIYREVLLVRSGHDGKTIVAVERETGEVRWERPLAEVGTLVSLTGRVREDATGVFTLHPLTGDIVNHTPQSGGWSFEIVTASDTRLVVVAGSTVTTYGMNDLGTSWQLDVGGEPDDLGVAVGYLVVRSGSLLRGFR